MRVTQYMLYSSMMGSIIKNQRKMLDYQTQVSTQKKVNDASDDPMGMAKILSYRETLSNLEQYPRNVSKARSWLDTTDAVLQELADDILGAKTLALQQVNGSNSAQSRQTAIEEVEGLIQSLIQTGNTKVGGQYIFGGTITNIKPFNEDGTYNGNQGSISAEIGRDTFQVYNLAGSNFLTTDLNPNIASSGSNTGLLDYSSQGYATGPKATLDLTILDPPAANTTYDLDLDLGIDGSATVTVTTDSTPTQDELGGALAAAINADDTLNNHVSASYNAGVLSLTAKTAEIKGNDYEVSSIIAPFTSAERQFSGALTKVESGFVFDASNSALVFAEDGGGGITADIITHGGATAGQIYSGEEVAEFLQDALEAQSAGGYSYTVSYNTEINRFEIINDQDNQGYVEFLWDDPLTTIAPTLGFDATASGSVESGISETSDNQVQFNVLAGVNDEFDITVDGTAAAATITLTAGSYTSATLAQEMQAMINADAAISGVTVDFSATRGGLFSIVSGSSGQGSSVIITTGGNDFLRTIGLVRSESVQGTSSVRLEDLNRGQGVRLDGGLIITDRAGNHVSLYTGAAQTITDIIDIINGKIVIGAPNGSLTVDESPSGGGPVTVALTPGTYTPQDLAAHIEAELDAASGAGIDYDVDWDPILGTFEISGDNNFDITWSGQQDIAQTLGFTQDDAGGNDYFGDSSFLHGIAAAINANGNGIQLIDNNPAASQLQPLRIFDSTTARDLGIFNEDTLVTFTNSNNLIFYEDTGGTVYRATLGPSTYNGNQMVDELKTALEQAVATDGTISEVQFDDISYDPNTNKITIGGASENVTFYWVNPTPAGYVSSAAPVLGFTQDAAAGTDFTADQVAGAEGRSGNITGSDLNPLVKGYTSITQLYAGSDTELTTIHITNGQKQATVDLSGARNIQEVISLINGSGVDVAVRINQTNTGLEIYSLTSGTVPVVEDGDEGETATLLGLQAGNDILGTLRDFKQALINDDTEAIERIVGNLQAALDRVEDRLGETGSRSINLEEMESYLDKFNLDVKELLSETEDVDITEAVTRFLNQQTAYETALAASAQVMQISLLDFLT